MKKELAKNCIIYIFITLSLFAAPTYSEAEPELPENYVYHIYWSGIRAGMATIDFIDTGEKTRVSTHAASASIISLFYRVDDVAESIAGKDGYPEIYTLKIEEGRHRRNKETIFEPGGEEGTQKIVYNNIRRNETDEFYLSEKAYDPLSALNEMRKRPLKIGQNEYIDIFENKKLWKTEVQVLKKERIRVPAGEFDTIMIKPMLRSEGIFLKKGDIYIWLSDDETRIPVMIMSKSRIGSFKVKLVKGSLLTTDQQL